MQPLTGLDGNEDQFDINQSKLRAFKRISEKRALPIDHLVAVIHFPKELPDSATFPSPSKVIHAMSKQEIQQLMTDIGVFKKTDFDHKDYWSAVETLVTAQLKALSNQKEDDGAMH